MALIEKLDYKSDLNDALLTLSPDGPIDAAGVTWTGTNNADPANPVDLGSLIEPDPAGTHLRAIVRLPTDAQAFDFTVTATAGIDDPATPDIETINSVFHLAGEHSKATDLGGTAGTVAKGGPLP